MSNLRPTGPRPIDPFSPGFWEPGGAEKALAAAEAQPTDALATGQFKSGFSPEKQARYEATLGGKDIATYDPDGFLKDLGVERTLAAGRTGKELMQAFHLVDYKPDPRYLPVPKWLAPIGQKLLLGLGRISPRASMWVDSLAEKLIVRRMEKKDMDAANAEERYGKVSDVQKGERSTLKPSERYFGLVRRKQPLFGWGHGVHAGSIDPDRNGAERFGTYDVALSLGFDAAQAQRIAEECYHVDTDQTHYLDPSDPSRPRTTRSGSGGDKGDFHWHFNRAKAGEEDTRLVAARTHLDRAVDFAGKGYYDAAERELGIGLHSLQDVFAHAQMSPLMHALLGEFPDFVSYDPVAMVETANATRGYLALYAKRLALAAPTQKAVAPAPSAPAPLVGGEGSAKAKEAVRQTLGRYPAELLSTLRSKHVRIVVGSGEEALARYGFGLDLNGNGRITRGTALDVNRDGRIDPIEREDRRPDGSSWQGALGAYNHETRLLFIDEAATKSQATLEAVMRHELAHVIDMHMSESPELGARWQRYLERLADTERRRGKLTFGDVDAHEIFADTQEEGK